MNWTKVFAVNTSRTLHQDEADLWYKDLCQEVRGFDRGNDAANDAEIAAAIRYAYRPDSDLKRPKNKFDITKNDLRHWIFTRREEQGANDFDPEKAAKRKRLIERFDDIKRQIREESDPCKIWDLICSPMVEEGFSSKVYPILETYAMQVHPEWTRPHEYIASKWKAVREAMNQTAENMRDVPGEDEIPF